MWAVEAWMSVRAIRSIATAIIAVTTMIAMVTIITVVTAPVVIAPASTAAPAVGVSANGDLKIKISGHITEHVAPDIIEHIEAVVPPIVAAPAVMTVITVPWHVPCNCR